MKIVKKYIKDIDRDCNGYVTNQELDDIFKLVFPSQLGDKDLIRLFRPFASIQNTILIDYKQLYSFLETTLA
jgi:Ca2+-binding EF-hand superfamily protein